MNYTKGRWVKDYNGTTGHIKAISPVGTPTVCRYDPPPNCATTIPIEERQANAQLIASAPLLYEAVRWVLEDYREDNYTKLKASTHTQLLKALAKAEGR